MNNIISVENLSKTYGDKQVVKGISFNVRECEIFGFLGPNGAGKTTTIRMMIGEIAADSGKIEIAGLNVPKDMAQLKTIVGVVPDYQNIYDRLSVRANLEFFASLNSISKTEVDRVLEEVFLTEHQQKACKNLSRGLRQRTLIARALLHKPKVFFLDEPTSALDPMSAKLIRELILKLKNNGTTVFLTTHYMEEADLLCDKIAIMNLGNIVASGSPQGLKDKIGRKAVVYEYDVEGEMQKVEFSLSTKEDREKLATLLREHEPIKIHTQEATLEEVFLSVTGNKWNNSKENNQ
ncbi:MAG: ABC transporter ATP-binding protein [Pusillimonas sp.]